MLISFQSWGTCRSASKVHMQNYIGLHWRGHRHATPVSLCYRKWSVTEDKKQGYGDWIRVLEITLATITYKYI